MIPHKAYWRSSKEVLLPSKALWMRAKQYQPENLKFNLFCAEFLEEIW